MCPIAAPLPRALLLPWSHHYGFCSATPYSTPLCTSGLVVSTDPGLCLVLNYKDDVPWGLYLSLCPRYCPTILSSSFHSPATRPHLHSHLDL